MPRSQSLISIYLMCSLVLSLLLFDLVKSPTPPRSAMVIGNRDLDFNMCVCVCARCRSLTLNHQCLLLLHHARPWLLEIEIWISMCVRAHVCVCVCVRERERESERSVKAYSIWFQIVMFAGYYVWYLRKCNDRK